MSYPKLKSVTLKPAYVRSHRLGPVTRPREVAKVFVFADLWRSANGAPKQMGVRG